MVVRPKLECILLEKYTVAPAPSRDYYGVKVSPSKILLYHWKISRFQNLVPTVQQIEMGQFMTTPSLHNEVEYIFGKEILLHIIMAAKGKSDCLSILPLPILIRIITFLDLKDIASIASTCKRFANMVKTNDDLWMKLYTKHFYKTEMTKEEQNEIRFWGWRRFYRKKLFPLKNKTQSNSFTYFQGNKAGKLPYHTNPKKKKDVVHIVKSNASPLDMPQHRNQHKNINPITTDKKSSNKTVAATTSKLVGNFAPVHTQPKTKGKSGKIISSQSGTEFPAPISFKNIPPTSTSKKHENEKFPVPIKSGTTRNIVSVPKIFKNK